MTKIKMLLKPVVGARFCREEVTTTKGPIWGPIVFLGRETELCQNLHRTAAREGPGYNAVVAIMPVFHSKKHWKSLYEKL